MARSTIRPCATKALHAAHERIMYEQFKNALADRAIAMQPLSLHTRHMHYKHEGVIMDDPYNLQRFVDAQDPVYADVCAELGSGRKRSHWMWFVFPQISGLGSSAMAQRYAIASLAEARAYLAHPVLGVRLKETTRLVNAVEGTSLKEILGYPDDLKFRSSMTLFKRAASENHGEPTANPDVFAEALRKYFNGEDDAATLRLL